MSDIGHDLASLAGLISVLFLLAFPMGGWLVVRFALTTQSQLRDWGRAIELPPLFSMIAITMFALVVLGASVARGFRWEFMGLAAFLICAELAAMIVPIIEQKLGWRTILSIRRLPTKKVVVTAAA